MDREEVVRAIFEAINRLNELRAPDQRLAGTEETVLYGGGTGLTSLDLVSLIVDVEEAVNERTGGGLVLADERAVAQKRNPFRDVRTFADYVMDRLRESEPCPPPPSS
jgi:acyl carrier protein